MAKCFIAIKILVPYVKGADEGVCHESPWVVNHCSSLNSNIFTLIQSAGLVYYHRAYDARIMDVYQGLQPCESTIYAIRTRASMTRVQRYLFN